MSTAPQSRRWVFFETITPAYRPLVAWYLSRGDRVSVFDFSYQLKPIGWLRKLIHDGKVECIYIHNGSRADGLAAETADRIYESFRFHPLTRSMERRFGPEEVSWPLRYALSQEVFRHHYVRLALARVREREGRGLKLLLIPETAPAPADFSVPWAAHRWARTVHGARKLRRHLWRYGGILATLFWIGLARLKRPGKETAPEFQCALSIDTRFQAQFSGPRRFDFLLDHRTLHKGNTLFLVSDTGEGPWMEEARKAGYRVIRRSDYTGLKGYRRHPPRTLSLRWAFSACLAGFGSLRAPAWLQEGAGLGLWLTVKETGLLERIRFRNYVYTNLYGLVPRWRNVLLRQGGRGSWCYAYSSGGTFTRNSGGPFAGDQDFGDILRIWAFENPDHLVLPCRPLIDYHRKHRQRTRYYHDVGNIWSEQILLAERTTDRLALLREWFGGQAAGKKVIAWFDSSFVEAPNSPSTFREGVRWYSDILRLLEEDGRLLAVIKPSKDSKYYVEDSPRQQWALPSAGEGLLEVWDKLKQHPRVRFLDRKTDPTLVVAVSDLTVTFPYTSVSAEALGARKPGIWYEPGERWRDTFYDRLPGLVAHGYAELKEMVERILLKMTPQEYEAHLEHSVRGPVDSFLDGKGISRFRALLAGTEAASGGPVPEALHEAVGDRRPA